MNRNAAFVTWMLGYPIVFEAMGYLHSLYNSPKVFTDEVETLSAFCTIAIWFGIGALIWKKGGKP